MNPCTNLPLCRVNFKIFLLWCCLLWCKLLYPRVAWQVGAFFEPGESIQAFYATLKDAWYENTLMIFDVFWHAKWILERSKATLFVQHGDEGNWVSHRIHDRNHAFSHRRLGIKGAEVGLTISKFQISIEILFLVPCRFIYHWFLVYEGTNWPFESKYIASFKHKHTC